MSSIQIDLQTEETNRINRIGDGESMMMLMILNILDENNPNCDESSSSFCQLSK